MSGKPTTPLLSLVIDFPYAIMSGLATDSVMRICVKLILHQMISALFGGVGKIYICHCHIIVGYYDIHIKLTA